MTPFSAKRQRRLSHGRRNPNKTSSPDVEKVKTL
jgi:hypothetical protein